MLQFSVGLSPNEVQTTTVADRQLTPRHPVMRTRTSTWTAHWQIRSWCTPHQPCWAFIETLSGVEIVSLNLYFDLSIEYLVPVCISMTSSILFVLQYNGSCYFIGQATARQRSERWRTRRGSDTFSWGERLYWSVHKIDETQSRIFYHE